MPCSDVELACCRLCGKIIASDRGECIHCGVCNPVKKDHCPWWHVILVIAILLGTIIATLNYQPGYDPYDCAIQDIRGQPRC